MLRPARPAAIALAAFVVLRVAAEARALAPEAYLTPHELAYARFYGALFLLLSASALVGLALTFATARRASVRAALAVAGFAAGLAALGLLRPESVVTFALERGALVEDVGPLGRAWALALWGGPLALAVALGRSAFGDLAGGRATRLLFAGSAGVAAADLVVPLLALGRGVALLVLLSAIITLSAALRRASNA